MRTQEIKRGPRKGEDIMIDPPHLEPSDPDDRERMRTHWENGWSFYVGSELYVLMDSWERGQVYQRTGPRGRFSIPLGKAQEIFKSQLSSYSKAKVKRDREAVRRRAQNKEKKS